MTKPKKKRTLPLIGKIAKLDLKCGETIAIFSKQAIPHASQMRMIDHMRALYPTNPVLIFEEGMQMSVVSPPREAKA